MLPTYTRPRTPSSTSDYPRDRRSGRSPRSLSSVANSGVGLPCSPLVRLGCYTPRLAGTKKQTFSLGRARRHTDPNEVASTPVTDTTPSSSDTPSSSSSTSMGSPPAATLEPVPANHLSPLQLYSLVTPSTDIGRQLLLNDMQAKAMTRTAQQQNDSMVYLEGRGHIVYSCAHCRTHLTSHEDILSKSFHGRHGRAFLFDSCVNVTLGPAEDRLLITGLHKVCDLHCKRCEHLVGWTYQRAYEASQKYKEGKFIIEKINLYVEHDDEDDGGYLGDGDRKTLIRSKKMRSHSWGNAKDSFSSLDDSSKSLVYEYAPLRGNQL